MLSVLVVAAATSRSEAPPADEESPPALETTNPATAPLGPNPPHAPSTLYDQGPPSAVWERSALTAAERASVDHDDQNDWRKVHDAYQSAIDHAAKDAPARMAQARLGLAGLDDVGVVP